MHCPIFPIYSIGSPPPGISEANPRERVRVTDPSEPAPPMNWGVEISFIALRKPIDESMGWDIIHRYEFPRIPPEHPPNSPEYHPNTHRIPPNELGGWDIIHRVTISIESPSMNRLIIVNLSPIPLKSYNKKGYLGI